MTYPTKQVAEGPVAAMVQGKKRLTPDQETANMYLRATEVQVRSWKASVRLCITNCPSVLPLFMKCMESNGYTAEKIAVPEERNKSLQAQAVEQRIIRKKSRELEMLDSQAQSGGSETITKPVPTKYWKLTELSRCLLRDHVLPGMEPVNLKPAHCKSGVDRLGMAASKREYLRLVTFGTGKEDLALSGSFRCFARVAASLHEKALARGRRCLLLTLPARWPIDGIFEIGEYRLEKKVVVIRQKWTKECVEIPVAALPTFNIISDLWIDMNWSEMLAAVCSQLQDAGDDQKAYSLANHFTNHLVEEGYQLETSSKKEQVNLIPCKTECKRQRVSEEQGAAGVVEPAGTATAAKTEDHGVKTDLTCALNELLQAGILEVDDDDDDGHPEHEPNVDSSSCAKVEAQQAASGEELQAKGTEPAAAPEFQQIKLEGDSEIPTGAMHGQLREEQIGGQRLKHEGHKEEHIPTGAMPACEAMVYDDYFAEPVEASNE